MNKSRIPSILKASLMVVLLAGALSAHGAGLGKLSVFSGIGQQLQAEVALTATPAELLSMSAKLASHEAFREAGVEFAPLLTDLRISIDKNAAGQPVLKLTTARPVTEPFLHFLVELNWTSGRLVREYTFLLDPPELLQAARPASVVAPSAPAIKHLPPAVPVPTRPAAVAAVAPPATGEYRVKPGDTLGKIARETRAESVTLDQMLVALFVGNRDAFVGDNMNRLRSGKILRVPSVEEAGNVDAGAARRLVIDHAGEFNVWRNRLAAAAAAAEAPPGADAPRHQVGGEIRPQVEDKTAVPVARDKLEVSRTEPAKTAAAVGKSLEEDLIARDKALREASERIAMLEKNIANLKNLVEVKSQTGARLQQESEAVQPRPAEKPAEPVKAAEAAAAPEVAPPLAAQAPLLEPQAAQPAAAEPPKPVEPAVAPPPPPEAQAPAPAMPPPPPEPGFIAENPGLVYGGGLVALLLGYLGYASWRRKKASAQATGVAGRGAAVASVVVAADTQEVKAAVPGVPASSFDTGEISIQGEFSDGGLLSDAEIVDPLAEADVLMAYGRTRQAEEILREALENDPARTAIHMKLLELYAQQGNVAQFEAIAEKLHALCDGSGADWDKTLVAARTLGLAGGIFGAVAVAAAVAEPVAAPVAAPITEHFYEPAVTVAPLQATEEEVGQVVPQPVTGTLDVPVGEQEPSLEFDFDLGAPEKPATAVSVADEPPAVGVPGDDELSLDFDFDLGDPEVERAVDAKVDHAMAPAEVNLDAMDFDLDLGSPVDAVVAVDGDIRNAATAPDKLAEVPPDTSAVVGGVGDLQFDFDLELDSAHPVELAASKPLGEETTELVLDVALADEPVETPAYEVLIQPDNPEATTKLELAQAYEEMGDIEGARELLNEVVGEGSASQQAQARAKLDRLGV